MFFVIPGWIAPLRDLWFCLQIQWFGEIARVAARGRVRFADFMWKHEKYMKIWKNHDFHEFPWSLMKIMIFLKNHDFWGFRGPRTLIFLRNYWCFCVPTISHQKVIFHRKTQNRTFSSFLPFLLNFTKKVKFLEKEPQGAQDPSKCMK